MRNVMNTATQSGINTAYSAQFYELSNKLAVVQHIVNSVMNTAAQTGSNTTYIAQIYEINNTHWPLSNSTLWLVVQFSLSRPQRLSVWLRFYVKMLTMMIQVAH